MIMFLVLLLVLKTSSTGSRVSRSKQSNVNIQIQVQQRLEEGVPANLTCILHTVDQTIESVLEPSFRIVDGDELAVTGLENSPIDGGISFSGQFTPTAEMNLKLLICELGLETSTPTMLRVMSTSGLPKGRSIGNTRSMFSIVDRYPHGQPAQIPEIILKTEIRFNFNCSSQDVWLDCKWKFPISEEPCAMYKSSSTQSCSFGDFKINYHKSGALHVCSIFGTLDPTIDLQGDWNCDLTSLPIEEDKYDDDQQFFKLKYLKPALVSFTQEGRRGGEKELFEGENLEMTCSATQGFPEPEIVWLLNSQPVNFDSRFKVLETVGPRLDSAYNYFLKQRIQYTASTQENGKTISCKVVQTDDEENISEVYDKDEPQIHLFIKDIPLPPPAVVTAEMIAGIVLVIIALLLALAVVGFAFYTKRWCFTTPIVTMPVEAHKSRETGEMIIQTEEMNEIKLTREYNIL
ncbi:uncharacterized protein LOC111701147 [Eurytemora carolleeae]|uniref:uncharacterized protein LOC111701147 n=1 Tax=Eurytemora carolleeae TaxID=1294199 RepID=UPI000C77424D|nr:uncharacterized protein LOC111701147 [Eurytemora carolleeae]|eukprot:XP_023328084.1 uncharacterized protein LOC111701147 [Eurytemora affinis]